MAWTAPMTAVDGNVYTAAQFNLYVRDNLNYLKTEMDGNPRALATTAGQYPVATGAGVITMRSVDADTDTTLRTTTSNSYVALGGTACQVSVVTGTRALVSWSCQMSNNVVGFACFAGIAVSGASTVAADDNSAISRTQPGTGGYASQCGTQHWFTGLTPGTNTFTMHHKVTGSTTGSFAAREIIVQPL